MRGTHNNRGAALILTLVTIAIVGALAGGIGTLVIGHFGRSRTDQDAAKALNLAEAALNFQVQKINANLGKTQTPYDGTNIATATYGVDSDGNTLTRWPNEYPVGTTNPMSFRLALASGETCTSWLDPSPLNLYNNDPANAQYLYGQGTVNGVTRVVRAKGGAKGIFDDFAMFAMDRANLSGGSQLTVVGTAGGNGFINNPSNSANISALLLAGPDASTNITSVPVTYSPAPMPYPPITGIANDAAKGIQDWPDDPNLTDDAPSYGGTIPINQGILNFSGSNNDRAFSDYRPTDPTWNGMNPNGLIPLGGTVANGYTLTLKGKPWGSNYYLNGIDIRGDIVADLSQGSINLWIDSNKATGDSISGRFSAIGNTQNQFRIHYRNQNNLTNANRGILTLGGGGSTLNIAAMIYVYDVYPYPGGNPFGAVTMLGNINMEGSLIANNIDNRGSVSITHPSNPGAQRGEGILFYGLQTPWQEYSPVRGY